MKIKGTSDAAKGGTSRSQIICAIESYLIKQRIEINKQRRTEDQQDSTVN
jgi:hypothetical protein